MSDIDILHELIKDTARVSLEDHYDRKKVILTESLQIDASVTIYNLPEDAVVIKADDFEAPDTIFNGHRGECKRADYVIVTQTDQGKVILYIELKAKRDAENQIIQQLKGAYCFVAYCREIGQMFWDQQDFLDGYIHRFVSIGHIRLPKKQTRVTHQNALHDHPERMMKISNPHHLQFKQLVGKT